MSQSHQNHTSTRAVAESQQHSQVSAAEIMSAAGLAAMAATELGNSYLKYKIIFSMAQYRF